GQAPLGPEPRRQRADRRARLGGGTAGREDRGPTDRRGAAARAPHRGRRNLHGGLPRDPDPDPGEPHRGKHRRAPARRALRLVRLPTAGMRIVVDVSPLSHPRTGIGNYIRGSLAGMGEAAAGRHELLAFAPTSLRGPARIRAALDGVAAARRLIPLPASHALRTGWSRLGHPAVELAAGRLDAFLFSEWMYPAQRGGVRATVFHDLVPFRHPEWCTPRTISMHTRKARNAAATCDVVFANSRATADDLEEVLGIEPRRIVHAPPGLDPGLTPDGW